MSGCIEILRYDRHSPLSERSDIFMSMRTPAASKISSNLNEEHVRPGESAKQCNIGNNLEAFGKASGEVHARLDLFCIICRKTFATVSSLKRHIKQEHQKTKMSASSTALFQEGTTFQLRFCELMEFPQLQETC